MCQENASPIPAASWVKRNEHVIAGHSQTIPSQPTTGAISNGYGMPVLGPGEKVKRCDQVEACEILGSSSAFKLHSNVSQRLIADASRPHA
jgi:hypothetical protein